MVDAGVDADRRKRYSAARRSRVGRQRSGRSGMKLLAVHPSGLMYTRVFLTLEPLGLELVAGAARAAGHEVRIVDLQVERPRRLWRLIDKWRPDAVCLGGNYLANVPEIIDAAKSIKI